MPLAQASDKPEVHGSLTLDHQIEQLELQLEDLQVDEAEAEREMPEAYRAPRRKLVRRPLPDHLPRDGKVYAPGSDACPSCGGGLRHLGEDVAEQVKYVRASFHVTGHVRLKLACSCCDAIVQAPTPLTGSACGYSRRDHLRHPEYAKSGAASNPALPGGDDCHFRWV